MELPPVALFTYNRPGHTRRTLEALARNRGADRTRLVIFSDGPASATEEEAVSRVRAVCRQASGFAGVELVERENNLGLAASIRTGVMEVLDREEAVVVLEDDLLTHPAFLSYLHTALDRYKEDSRLLSVSAFVPPRILMPRPSGFSEAVWLSLRNLSFGWGVWRDRWRSVNWNQAVEDGFVDRPDLQAGFRAGGADLPRMMQKQLQGETDSWAIHFSYAHFRQQRYSLMPADSYVKPIGYDGSGVHCRPSPLAWLSTTRHAREHPDFPPDLQPHSGMQAAFRRYMDRQYRAARLLGRV